MKHPSWRSDKEYEDETITEVRDDWTVGLSSGFHFGGLEKSEDKPAPRLGATLRMFERGGWGFPIRGVVMDPESDKPTVYYYRTAKEEKARHKEWVADEHRKKQEEFERNRKDMDRRVAALPKPFQKRIEFFREHCPTFRWEHEPYELFVCEEAVKIASAIWTAQRGEESFENIAFRFKRASWKQQKKMVPALSEEHSGNTFDFALVLARAYLMDGMADERDQLVFKAHGALAPLVGCKDYGCMHPRGART